MIISRQAVAEFLDRELDDYRWMKRLSRERLMRELESLRVRPRFKTEPWIHQLVCFYIGLCQPRFMFLLDMGAGKTKILTDLISHRLRSGQLDRALISVPRLSNISSWMEGVVEHSELEPWAIDCTDTEEKYERLIRPRGEVTIVDTHGLMLALSKRRTDGKVRKLAWDEKKIKELAKIYNFLGLDEIHKLGGTETLWHSIYNQISRRMDFVYGATGTLFGKQVERLWAPFYLVDRGETFGENLGPFRAAFFDAKTKGWKVEWEFNKGMDRELNRMLQHRSIRYEESELPKLPEGIPILRHLDMGLEQREHYMNALEGLINAGGDFRELDAQYVRMRQIVAGYLAWEDDLGKHVKRFKDNPKLRGLEADIDELSSSKFIIVYWYTETGKMLVDHLKHMGISYEWLWGGTKDHTALRARFLDPKGPQALVMQAEAGGTGNDGLQRVARYMFFYETPTDPITRKQTEKRIERQGQRFSCRFFDYIMKRTLDKGILDDIKAGVDLHKRVVNGNRMSKNYFLGGG